MKTTNTQENISKVWLNFLLPVWLPKYEEIDICCFTIESYCTYQRSNESSIEQIIESKQWIDILDMTSFRGQGSSFTLHNNQAVIPRLCELTFDNSWLLYFSKEKLIISSASFCLGAAKANMQSFRFPADWFGYWYADAKSTVASFSGQKRSTQQKKPNSFKAINFSRWRTFRMQ